MVFYVCEREEGRGRVNREGRIDWGDFIILFLPHPHPPRYL